MLNLRKGPLYEMLGEATKGRLAGNRSAVDTTANHGMSPSQGRRQAAGEAPIQIRLEDSPLATDHLTPGLPPELSPKTASEAVQALQLMVKESDSLAARWKQIEDRLPLLIKQLAPKPGHPTFRSPFDGKRNETRQEILNEIRSLEVEGKRIQDRQKQLASVARNTLAIPQAQRGKTRFFDTELENINADMSKAWQTGRQGALLVEQYIHPSLLPEVTFTSDADATRSAYLHQDNNGVSRRLVILNPHEAGVITAMHEITHAVECSEVTEWNNGQPTVRQPLYEMARTFLLKRASGMPSRKMKYLNPDGKYEDHEMSFEDEWAKRGGDHYTGRDYQHPMTEIFTTGLQRLHDDPVRFLSEDPEHFAFVLNLRYPVKK